MTDRITDRALATSADYADALLVARKAKHVLFLLIFIMLLLQLALFFVARYTQVIPTASRVTAAAVNGDADPAPVDASVGAATTVPSADAATTLPLEPAAMTPPRPQRNSAREILQYLSGMTLFLGTVLPILLAFTLLVIVNIMLIGRLIGVTRVLSAFFLCLVLVLMMFPWQIYFGIRTGRDDFRVPGVLYTWNDLRTNANFPTGDMAYAFIKWVRFVGMPVVATVLLMMVQGKSNRGMRQALGESTAPPENISISV